MTINKRDIDELLRFLPGFEQQGREYVERWSGDGASAGGNPTVSSPVYAEDVQAFFELAAEERWCDSGYDPVACAEMIRDDRLIAIAGIEQVRSLITYCVRGERFCDGHRAEMLESGRVAALLRRLRQLRESL